MKCIPEPTYSCHWGPECVEQSSQQISKRLGELGCGLLGVSAEALFELLELTGLFNIFWRLLFAFFMWCFKALESSGFNNSKLHSNSAETDMTAPQLSNSPQYCSC
jgi:hypothetical protein